jgi:DNA polymerase-3 subunit alpha
MKNADMVSLAKKQGLRAIAQTNHGNIDGALRHVKACKASDIQPIIGCEAYMLLPGEAELMAKKRIKRNHLTLLVRDAVGMQLLMKALTAGWGRQTPLNNFSGIPIEQPIEDGWAGHIVILSGCASSPFWKEKGLDWLQKYRDVFKQDLYAEIMPIYDFEQQRTINKLATMSAKALDLKIVTTTDAHYCTPGDSESHQVLLAVGTHQHWHDPNRFKFDSKLNYMRTGQELVDGHIRMGLDESSAKRSLLNTLEIAEKCSFIPDKIPLLLPDVLPPGTDEVLWMVEQCHLRMEKLGLASKPEYVDRLETELRAIIANGFVRYILLVADVVNWAKRTGIAVGPGRGSSAGSLVCWMLGITECDPVKYGLLFARFISQGRADPLDIDSDFEDGKRWMIEQYLQEKYGEGHVAKVSTFSMMRGKDAIKSVGRVFGLPIPEVQRMANSIIIRPDSDARSSTSILDAVESFEEAKTFNGKYPQVVENAAKLEGQVKNVGIHAAGLVVSKHDLRTGKNGVLVNRKGETVVNWDKKDLETMGLMKLDVLGLKTLSVLESCRVLISNRHNKSIVWADVDLEDKETYAKTIRTGQTATCFQIGSRGLQKFSSELKTSNFKTVYDSIALWRPGCLKAGITKQYADRHRGLEEPVYLGKVHQDICKDTYGLVIYQEQVMQFMHRLAGMPWQTADQVRKIIGRKTGGLEFDKFKGRFVEGCKEQKTLTGSQAETLWDSLRTFAQYAFNLSHSVTYAMLGFWTAWAKTHYPAEYMCAYLNYGGVTGTEGMSKVPKLDEAIREARRMGLAIDLPDVNSSGDIWSISASGSLLAGISEIRGISPEAAGFIIEARTKAGGKFSSISNLVSTVNRRRINRGVIQKLVLSGSMDKVLGETSRVWKLYFDELYESVLSDRQLIAKISNLQPRVEGDWTARRAEMEDLAHSMIRYKPEFGSAGLGRFRKFLGKYISIADIRDLAKAKNHDQVYCVGVATAVKFGFRENVKQHSDDGGNVYGTLDDGTGYIMASYEADLYSRRKATIESMAGKPVMVRGRWMRRRGSIIVDRLWTLEELAGGKFRGLSLPILSSAKTAWHEEHKKSVLSCSQCDLRSGCRAPIPGSIGNLRAMIVGEAPSYSDESDGKLLSGNSGRVLWDYLSGKGLPRSLFQVETVLHCKSKDGKFPGMQYVSKCNWLSESIKKSKPLSILAMGNAALYYFSGRPHGIREKNGKTEWVPAVNAWVTYCVSPSSVLHDESNRPEFERGVSEFVRVLGEIS